MTTIEIVYSYVLVEDAQKPGSKTRVGGKNFKIEMHHMERDEVVVWHKKVASLTDS